jgi:tRNA(Ile)-lysidine synthase
VDAFAALLARVEQSLADLSREAPGVVAVSGGPDSVALLRTLLGLGWGSPLVIAHLNHSLRGAESDGDEAFVRSLHAALSSRGRNVLLRCERVNVAAVARAERANLESTARRVRYQWLTSVAREVGAAWVATGHTADDQAETVLHRILRGTGLRGLGGIPARRELAPGVVVVRPLLRVRRHELLAFLEALGQAYRQDRSNADARFTRNRIRHELLPRLAADYNPAVVDVLCRLADQAAEVHQEAAGKAAVLLHEAELPRAGGVLVFDAERLARASRPLVRAMLRLVWTREGWPQGRLGFDDWQRIAAVALGEAAAVDLAGGVRVRRAGRVVRVERTSIEPA